MHTKPGIRLQLGLAVRAMFLQSGPAVHAETCSLGIFGLAVRANHDK